MKFLTITETSKTLNVHRQTIRNWIKKKRLTAYRPNPKGKIFIRLIDINKLFRTPINIDKEVKL